ncbi:MAG TPA: HD domain-containing phosphohydrolase [Geobacteraceae bacterium]
MEESVLFVDDEQNILRAVARALADEDFRVLTAGNAEEALHHFRNEEIAVMVTDNRMPGTCGIDLLATVKRLSPDTVNIMMTGYADLPTAIEAINIGEVFRFVVKPWQDDDLVQVLTDALGRYRIVKSLRKADDAVIRSIAQTIELKDRYTGGHCDRVARYALLIADGLDFSEAEKKHIRQGGWLHDCGKIGVPESVLNFPGHLSRLDFATVREHPVWGARVAREAQLPPEVINIILHHHERYDGKGYPEGLAGEDIPLEARIVAVADVFDTLTSDRPYHKACDWQSALAVMKGLKGSQLDPKLVTILHDRLRGEGAGD